MEKASEFFLALVHTPGNMPKAERNGWEATRKESLLLYFLCFQWESVLNAILLLLKEDKLRLK